MAEQVQTDICVIGGGSGGLSVAVQTSQLGAATVLIEKGRMGGDCLNYGCVPSKSLLAAAKIADSARHGARFGIGLNPPLVDFPAALRHVHDVIASIAPTDSVERYQGLGVRVIQAPARFTGPDRLEAGGVSVTARRFVIATGSRAMVPPIPGLKDVPFFTNETIFDNQTLPEHLLVIGGGPIGLELAQAHRRLGARVTVVEMAQAFGKDDSELAALVLQQLAAEGIAIHTQTAVKAVAADGTGIRLTVEHGGTSREIAGSHLLVAAGRQPNIEDLGLEVAGVAFTRKGITVDRGLRSSNRRIYAIGDVAGGPQFTHIAGYHAGIVVRNALFRLPAKADHSTIPWVTFTDPELAHVGLTEAEARQRHGEIRIMRAPFAESDRARAERKEHGLVKVITSKRGKILGASIVAALAGELLHPWVLAMHAGLNIRAMATMTAPYPTFGEVNKRAAGAFFTPQLLTPRVRRLVRFLARFG